ncbi:hypothetical protein HYH02_013023 [Chlamydomonas schloesseri]|uniref:Guanylate cyclase domain-containing protein n=1 Tax=Chlamydomonas schloesseri TaxID=2026947 RepID=A0A835SUY4_9CHLO|nr:hypothetical protein HYH02_013023 [Chlamydomonas schloesseri]|eukprot:KAG2432301.1 hypothetical protein HYH02_013023 [Chlamydomonas schloesseri]
MRASNFAQRALENRLLELERGGLIGGEVLSDWPETANPPVAVLDLDILCLPRDVEARLGLGQGSRLVSDPPLPVTANGLSGKGSHGMHWSAPTAPAAYALAARDSQPAAGAGGGEQLPPSGADTSSVERLPGGSRAALRAVTLESVRRGAEAANATVTLAVVEDMGEGGALCLLGRWGRRVLYASPAYVRLVDAVSEEVAIRGMNAAIVANTAIRASLVGFLKLLMVGGDVSPALLRNVYYHPDRRAEMVFMWMFPVLIVEEADVQRCLDQGSALADAAARPPRLGFVSYTDKASSLAREVESGLREHMCLKYTPTPVTMVDGEGYVVMQNAASITNIGIQGSEGRTAGGFRLNYLQELFVSDPTANDDMRAVTSTGRTWSRRLRVSDSPLLRAWMQLGPAEERWHEVAISRFRDPAYRAPTTAYIVAETDVTATVRAQRQVSALQRQQQALLREILPQQVIDVLLCHSDRADDARSPLCHEGEDDQEGATHAANAAAFAAAAASRLQRVLRGHAGDRPQGSPAASVHGGTVPGPQAGVGIPGRRGTTALMRSRTEPAASMGLLGAGAVGADLGPDSGEPGWDVPQGLYPPCAASVESSSLGSSVVSHYVVNSLSASRASGNPRNLTVAAASLGADPAAAEAGSSQQLGRLRGCASVESTPVKPTSLRNIRKPPALGADSLPALSSEQAHGPGLDQLLRPAPVAEQLGPPQPGSAAVPAAAVGGRVHTGAGALAEWLRTSANLPQARPVTGTSGDCSQDSSARLAGDGGGRVHAAGPVPQDPQEEQQERAGACARAGEGLASDDGVEAGSCLQLLLVENDEEAGAEEEAQRRQAGRGWGLGLTAGSTGGSTGLLLGRRGGSCAPPVDGSPALGDSEADADGEGRPRRASGNGYSDCGGRRLSRRDVMALATWHEAVTVVFADVVGFTSMCQQLHPARVMAFLDDLYNAFDHLLDETGCYKVETIGDCYMVCSGLFGRPPSPRAGSNAWDLRTAATAGGSQPVAGGSKEAHAGAAGADMWAAVPPEHGSTQPPQLGGFDPDHASRALQFARRLVQVASSVRTPVGTPVQMRVGLHSGSVVSGVVGRRMPRFCLFGDTVNTASRMESTGAPGRIHVSEATRSLLPGERWEPRGTGIDIKGRGRMQTYWLWDAAARPAGAVLNLLPTLYSSRIIAAAAAAPTVEHSGVDSAH